MRERPLVWLACIVGSSTAVAEPRPTGAAIDVGAGIEGFSWRAARALSSVAVAWEARVQFATRAPLSLEAAYAGAASSTLTSTTLELDLRANLRPGRWQPYVFAGMGWRKFDVMAQPDDHTVVVPFGGGLQVSSGAWRVDLRMAYRLTEGGDLVGKAALDTWSAVVRIGIER